MSVVQKNPRTAALYVLTVVLSVFMAFLISEFCSRAVEKWWDPGRFRLLREQTYESFFYYHGGGRKTTPATVIDPILGWRNAFPAPEGEDGVNPEGWRISEDLQDGRERIVLIGDSFVYGWQLPNSETIPSYLEHELNNEIHVINLGVKAWGLDQMALAATQVAVSYRPRIVVVAFIADDLQRSCRDFNFNLSKPRFVLKGGIAYPMGIPVPTIQQKRAEHSSIYQRLLDGLEVWATRSRLVCLAGQLVLQRERQKCMSELAPALLDYVLAHTGQDTKVLFVHLDGALPPKFENRAKSLPNFFSIPSRITRISGELGIAPAYQPDGHPTASLNRIYARALAEILNRIN